MGTARHDVDALRDPRGDQELIRPPRLVPLLGPPADVLQILLQAGEGLGDAGVAEAGLVVFAEGGVADLAEEGAQAHLEVGAPRSEPVANGVGRAEEGRRG